MSKTGKILGFGAFGLALLTASKNKASKTAVKDVAPLAFSANGSDIDSLVNTIKNNGAIRTLLKGEKGDTGATGATGATGDIFAIYSRSIIGNSALLSDSIADYTGDGVVSDTDFEGLKTIVMQPQKFVYSKHFPINIRRVYVAEFSGKTGGSCLVALQRFDKAKQMILNSGDSLIYVANNTFSNTSFAEKKIYFAGAVGSAVNQHNINTVYSRLVFYSTSGVAELSRVVLREVDLGEAVPHNLVYLPLGQIVVNNTTGQVGRYNGSTVDWFM